MSAKKIVFFTFIIGSVFIINNLIHSISSLWQKKNLVVRTKGELKKEKIENQELKKKLTDVNNPQFIEQEARNKLLLTKPGEQFIVIPTDFLQEKRFTASQPKDTRPNWKKWWDVFF